MRLPESASLVGSLLSDLGRSAQTFTDNTDSPDVTEAALIEALDAMARGDIEYVILEDGEAFLQAAGSGDGPYQIQFRPSEREAMLAVAGDVNRQMVSRVLLDYRRRDPAWRTAQRWVSSD